MADAAIEAAKASRNGHARDPRVLSIQSHVVQGYVGNRSAVLPMQLLGIDVDIMNTVNFSNHTGYEHFTGKHLRLSGDDVQELLDGLEHNSLLQNAHTHLLTGYVGNPVLLRSLVKAYERIKALQKDPSEFIYVCDPVLGDLGKLYVPDELVDVYRTEVLPVVDVLTPNQYECELLAQTKISTVEDAKDACKKLHQLGPKVVVITSFQECDTAPELVVIGSKVTGEHGCEQYELRFPYIDSYYTGTGDLFAALLLGWLYRLPNDFKTVLETVLSTMQDVLRITLELGGKDCDLRLVQSRNVIANPIPHLTASPLAVPVKHIWVDFDLLLQIPSSWSEQMLEETEASVRDLPDALAPQRDESNIIQFLNECLEATKASEVVIVSSFATELTNPVVRSWLKETDLIEKVRVITPTELRALLSDDAPRDSIAQAPYTLVLSTSEELTQRLRKASFHTPQAIMEDWSLDKSLTALGLREYVATNNKRCVLARSDE